MHIPIDYIIFKEETLMDVVMFLYDMLILIVYTSTVTLSLIVYKVYKQKKFFWLAGIFSVYILDHLFITMAEMIRWFSVAYGRIFLTIPSMKTLVYAASFSLMILFLHSVSLKARTKILWFLLALIIIGMMFIPILPDNALKSWFYFFPAQFFLFIYSMVGLFSTKTCEMEEQTWLLRSIRRMYSVMAVFSVLIAAEDTFVIFRLDSYTGVIRIINRSFTEDMMRVILALLSSRIMIRFILQQKEPAEIDRTEEKDAKMAAFIKKYDLTGREEEIFSMMLNNMTNQEISDKLMISLGTVKTHTHNIFSKIEVFGRREALLLYQDYEPEK